MRHLCLIGVNHKECSRRVPFVPLASKALRMASPTAGWGTALAAAAAVVGGALYLHPEALLGIRRGTLSKAVAELLATHSKRRRASQPIRVYMDGRAPVPAPRSPVHTLLLPRCTPVPVPAPGAGGAGGGSLRRSTSKHWRRVASNVIPTPRRCFLREYKSLATCQRPCTMGASTSRTSATPTRCARRGLRGKRCRATLAARAASFLEATRATPRSTSKSPVELSREPF